jgi:DNA topoisomerase-1
VLTIQALQAAEPARSQAEAKKAVVLAVEAVAKQLGNTRAVCRKCYIHPEVIDRYLAGTLASAIRGKRSAESAVLALLKGRTKRERPSNRARLPSNPHSRGTTLAARQSAVSFSTLG